MSEKKFEITYSDEAKKVMEPIGKTLQFGRNSSLYVDGKIVDMDVTSIYKKVAVVVAERIDNEVIKHISKIVTEEGVLQTVVLDREVLAAKLKRLEPKAIVVHGYEPGRAVNSLSYTCPTCGTRIGKYPFCKYCGQALKIEN